MSSSTPKHAVITTVKSLVAFAILLVIFVDCNQKKTPTDAEKQKAKQAAADRDSRPTPPSIQIWETISEMKPGETKIPKAIEDLLGKKTEIGGFMILNEAAGEQVKEFLLTPISGGCVHVPPPPPNYIVHVLMPEGTNIRFTYGPVLVTGILQQPEKKEDRKYYLLELKGIEVGPFIYK